MKKYLIPFVVVTVLPYIANAGYTYDYVDTPAEVAENGMITVASGYAYQTVPQTNDDKNHIASTAYVKGAYNAAIAAINATKIEKQEVLGNVSTGGLMSNMVVGAGDIFDYLTGEEPYAEISLPSVAGVVAGIQSQRAVVYTTWDDDTASATREVAFVTASQQ